jgi:hypothetical protein
MSNIKPSYGAATALTITLNSLASGGNATSTAIAQSTDLALDVLVEIAVTTGTVGTNPNVAVYAIPSLDGTNYGDVTNAPLIGTISTPSSATPYRKSMPVAVQFGGSLPPSYKIYVVNNTGAALAGSGNSGQYVEISGTIV